jgi:hypothetical protein
MRSAASSEACRVVIVPSYKLGQGRAEPSPSRRRPRKGRRTWIGSPEELPGVEGVERMEGDGGNWGGPTQPDALRLHRNRRCPITGDEPGSGQRAGRASDAAEVPFDLRGQHNPQEGKGRAFVECALNREGLASAGNG